MMSWEDFKVGEAADIGRHTFSAEEIIAFGRQFDPQPFHTDPQAAGASAFGGLIASGWHVCAVGMRLLTESILGRTRNAGSPGIEKVRWLKPVRAGDTLAYRVVVAESRVSASKPGIGLIKHRWEAHNQQGELALTLEGWLLVARRDP